MTALLVLPGISRYRAPQLELARIQQAELQLRSDLREMIQSYGESYELADQARDRAEGYADDLVSDLFVDREEELRAKSREEPRREDDPWGLRHWRRPWTQGPPVTDQAMVMDQTERLRAIARSIGDEATASSQEAEKHLLLRQAAELEEDARRIENVHATRLNRGTLRTRIYSYAKSLPAKLRFPARV